MSTITPYARAWKFQLNSPYTATNTIFVDSFAGDDVRGLGTMAFPFQTLNKAVVFASANSKYYIVCRGYFSETIANGYSKMIFADSFGDFIWNGKNVYYYYNLSFSSSADPNTRPIVLNTSSMPSTLPSGGIFINVWINNGGGNFSVYKGIDYSRIATYGSLVYGIMLAEINTARIDFFNASRVTTNNSGSPIKCIYDNCKVFLDKNFSADRTFDTCLFRVNCTFWKRNAANTADERVDDDTMTAAQKYAAVMDWINNGTLATGYYKINFTNCQFTDNKIFNCPDNDRSGTNWDFSLIYGTKEAQPACYMDGGKHIGPFPPAIKIELRNTADLTTSAYEIEVKPTDNLNIVNGQLSIGPDFTEASIYSKPMLIPLGTQFNGFNVSLFPDAANSGIFVTGQTDSIDMSDANKLTIDNVGVALVANVCYLVKVGTGTSVVYNGTAYLNNTVLMATDSVLLATSNGISYLHPMPHPSLYQNVQYKVCESAVVPEDFKTNDVTYPWHSAECFSKPADPRSLYSTGLRCLRVGNVNGGAIDLGSDGKPLTSGHLEFYNTTNQARPKYFVRANYVMMKIVISRF